MKHLTRNTSVIVGSILVAVLFAIPAQAQQETASSASGDWADLIAQEGLWMDVVTGEAVPAAFADISLDALEKKEWKNLCKELTQTVRTSDGAAWERAVQDVIYLAFSYPEQVRFKGANLPLFYEYVLGRDEQHRIMALAAMHAIGDFNTMAQIGQRVRLERSPRVQRLAAAAVVDYFTKATIEVEEPRAAAR